MVSVSATTARTRSIGIPSSSAAIIASEIRVPLRSGHPETTTAVPSSFRFTAALD
jgi:hypothetical protein